MTKLVIPAAKTVEWSTPPWLFNQLHREFHFTVDAASSDENAKLPRHWTKEDSAFDHDWTGERIFCNPPFGAKELELFTARAYNSSCLAVFVVPVKADQMWWHRYALQSEIRFIRGRVTFGDAANCFPGPIAVLVFGTGRTGCFSMEKEHAK
jgi:site-specific DNA-methyltransferase (adenine-specific)